MRCRPSSRALGENRGAALRARPSGDIGPATFSAAQLLVDALEKYTNVTFVGEPTGSKGNRYGDEREIVLPNSGLTVCFPIHYLQQWSPSDVREATTPDIAAPLTFEAYRDNEDPALEAIERVTPQEPAR